MTIESIAEQLVDHAVANCRIVKDAEKEIVLARVKNQSGCYPVDSKGFKEWLIRSFIQMRNKSVSGSQVRDAILNIAARYTDCQATYERVAAVGDTIYFDLIRENKVVKITADGWRVTEECPVFFVPKKDMAPLPLPQMGGSLEDLKRFVNVSDEDFDLYLAFLLDALKGRKPYIILLVNGEEGSAKTTFSFFTGELLDPSRIAKTKSLPENRRDLAVLANNRYFLGFDNISRISDEMSDALCRLATGSGMVLRSLYTNAEEQIFGGARPILLNGIPEIGDRSDFLGRCIRITLQPIPEAKRIPEKELYAEFQERRPYILGALYSLLANGLKNEGKLVNTGGPRMADSYRWLRACEVGTEWKFSETFHKNVKEAVKQVALDTLLGKALIGFMKNRPGHTWEGTPSELHEHLRGYWSDDPKDAAKFPGNARWLSGELNKVASSLRENGIEITRSRDTTHSRRLVTINAEKHFTTMREQTVAPSVPQTGVQGLAP